MKRLRDEVLDIKGSGEITTHRLKMEELISDIGIFDMLFVKRCAHSIFFRSELSLVKYNLSLSQKYGRFSYDNKVILKESG